MAVTRDRSASVRRWGSTRENATRRCAPPRVRRACSDARATMLTDAIAYCVRVGCEAGAGGGRGGTRSGPDGGGTRSTPGAGRAACRRRRCRSRRARGERSR
eukprot:4037577-Prymnesium_polylepis.1